MDLPYLPQEEANANQRVGLWGGVGVHVEDLPGELFPGHAVEFISHPLGPGQVVAVVGPQAVREVGKITLICGWKSCIIKIRTWVW